MDRGTRDIYERHAREWAAKRRPFHLEEAEALARRSNGPSIDLGCGPGWHAAMLPEPTVALDGARAMLELVKEHAPRALRVQGDLAALPFRPRSFGTAWARNSYVHLPRLEVPGALAQLHRSMRVDARGTLAFFVGGDEGRDVFPDTDFGGRYFSRWDLDQLVDIVIGAGFVVDRVVHRTDRVNEHDAHVEVTCARTLADVVGPGMRVLTCGLNPSLYAADAGVGFARPGNRFWPAAITAGLVTVDRDPWHALRHHGVGFTDLVKRATTAADQLTTGEYRAGLARVERLAAWLEPSVVAFVGLAGWRAAVDRKAVAGLQHRALGGRPVYVMPSSSGLNARSSVDSLAAHLRAALALT
ncbi:MAG: double-stranded uracil-DNA glycosylase [Acidimicrobiaceae bacterium]